MSKYSEFLKEMKEEQISKFFGEVKKTSNKYFKFNHILNEDEIIIVTGNVKFIKDNFVLVVGNNKVVYLKEWNIVRVHNYDLGLNAHAVKLNRKYFKTYIFKNDFEDFHFEKDDTFESLMEIAKEQNDTEIALGWTK
nr:MAG TPA: hypothetical protein [Caudoviricetes sp.]